MQTDVTIDASGNLQATTRTHEMTVLHGFTGGVFVSLGDENHVIWNSQVQTFGVDGTGSGVIGGLLGSKSDRTDSWSDRVPLETLAKVRSIRIFHRPMPKEPIQLGAFANAISPLAGTFAKGAFITASESLSVDVVPILERALGADARWATRQVDMRCASGDAVVGLLYEGSYSALLGAVLSPLVKFQYAAAGPMLANAKAFVCMSAARRAGFPPASS